MTSTCFLFFFKRTLKTMNTSRLRPAAKTDSPQSRFRLPRFVLSIALLLTASGLAARAASLPPDSMTYQGFLVDANGNPLATNLPANYPVAFRLYATATGNTRLWSEQQIVTVDKGSFSVVLGEGTPVGGEARPPLSSLFSGATASERYLGISVTIGSSTLDVLPRLRLLPSAYAFLATSAGSLVTPGGSNAITYANNRVEIDGAMRVSGNALPALTLESGNASGTWLSLGNSSAGSRFWQLIAGGSASAGGAGNLILGTGTAANSTTNNPLVIQPDGDVGLGTTTPNAQLSLGSGLANTKLALWDGGVGAMYGFGVQGGQFRFHVNQAVDRFSFLNGVAGTEVMTVQGGGSVGIGTPNPAAKLDVRGDIRMGSAGDVLAAGSLENLRIVRGVVRSDGTRFNGAGYTVTRTSLGNYTLTFNPPFADVPAVTITPAPNAGRPCTATFDTGTSTSTLVQTWSGASPADLWFNFTAIGAR